VTGLSRQALERFGPALRGSCSEVEYLADPRQAMSSAAASSYDVVVAGYPLCEVSLQELAEDVRRRGPCRTAALVVLASPESVPEASAWVGRGVNKVLSITDPVEVLQVVLARLLAVAARSSGRQAVRVDVEACLDEHWHQWRTEDVSTTGMLIRTGEEIAAGRRFPFRLHLRAGDQPIEGEAKVVRLTRVGSRPVAAVGCRFCSFETDGRQRLSTFLISSSSTSD